MATLSDIAKHCGLSTATVSYVLSGQGDERRISAKTQELVRAAADELGYQRMRSADPDHLMVAVYWPIKHLQSSLPSLIDGMNAALYTESIHVDVVIRPFELGHIQNQETLWQKGSCDSAVIVAPNAEDMAHLEENPVKIPAVLLNRDLPDYSSVSIDHEKAGQLAAEHALSKGDSIALVLNPSTLMGLNIRGRVIAQMLQEHGVDLKDNIYYSENQIDDGYQLGWDMIRKNALPKIIICIYDMVGLGIMSAFNEAGIAIGEDVQIIATSSGMSRLFARSSPPMTVVDLKMEEVSERCLKMAIGLATRRITGPKQVVVHPSIIYRKSCPLSELIL